MNIGKTFTQAVWRVTSYVEFVVRGTGRIYCHSCNRFTTNPQLLVLLI